MLRIEPGSDMCRTSVFPPTSRATEVHLKHSPASCGHILSHWPFYPGFLPSCMLPFLQWIDLTLVCSLWSVTSLSPLRPSSLWIFLSTTHPKLSSHRCPSLKPVVLSSLLCRWLGAPCRRHLRNEDSDVQTAETFQRKRKKHSDTRALVLMGQWPQCHRAGPQLSGSWPRATLASSL